MDPEGVDAPSWPAALKVLRRSSPDSLPYLTPPAARFFFFSRLTGGGGGGFRVPKKMFFFSFLSFPLCDAERQLTGKSVKFRERFVGRAARLGSLKCR